jgi:anaerobic magnesium-protoporphyrin IX monomethyl ester cyclase
VPSVAPGKHVRMLVYLLNPTISDQPKYIREGRCMQKAASWATVWPPITLASMGAIARKYGDARVIDGNVEEWTLDRLIDDVREHAPDLVIVNTGFPSIDGDMAVAEAIKRAVRRTRVVGFGVYFTLLEGEGMKDYRFLDAGIVGEPEETFEELVAAIAAGRSDFEAIKGLLLVRDDEIVSTGPRALIDDVNRLPYPDRTLLHNDLYRLPHNDQVFTLVNTSRGCPYPCTFCTVRPYYGNRIRRHSLDYILGEMQECIERYGIHEFLFWEEVFTLDKAFVLEFCQAIRDRGWKIGWAATTRVTSIDEEVLRAMKDSGCYLLGMGIESSSQDILDRAKKKQTTADVERAVALCKKVGVETMGHCIFGLPGETPQTAEATIDYMTRLDLNYMQCYCAVPYPKTELGELAKKQGWVKARLWSQYDFGGDSIMDTDTITAREVTHFRKKAFRRFYLRPVYLLRTVLAKVTPRQIPRLLKFRDWIGTSSSRTNR